MFVCSYIHVIHTFSLLCYILQDSGDLCSQIGLCKSTRTMKTRLNKLMLTKPVTLKDGSYCDDCKEVLALIQPTIDSSSTESEVKEFLDKLCSMLPSDVSGTVSA